MSILSALSIKKTLFSGFVACLLSATLTTGAWADTQIAEPAQASLATPDWSLINLRLEDVAQDHINAFGFIIDAHAEIDLQNTDWDAGNLSFRFDVQSSDLLLLSTPNPLSVQLSGQFDVKTTDLGTDKKVNLTAEVSLNGDVVSVLRHINELIADCSTYDRADMFMVHFCAYSEHIAQNNDASTYQPALESLRDALVTLAPNNNRVPLIPPFNNQKGWMDEFFSVLMGALITGDDTSSSVVAEIDLSTLLNFPAQGQAVLKISNGSLLLSLTGEAVLSDADYSSYKNTLQKGLLLLQDGDPDFMAEIYQYSFLVFGLIEGFLN